MIRALLAPVRTRLKLAMNTRSSPRRRGPRRLGVRPVTNSRIPAFAGMSAVVVLALVGSAFAANAVLAEPSPVQSDGEASYSIWTVDGASVRVRVEVPVVAARTLDGVGAPAPSLARVASAVSSAVSVTTPMGDCEAIDQGEGVGQIYTLALTPGLDRYEIVFTCPQADGLVLKNTLLFDRDPRYVDYARIKVGAGAPVLQTFTRDKPSIALTPHGPGDASPADFARRAAIRLATNIAALGVLLGSLLICRRWLDLAWLGGALVVGAAAALAVALPGHFAVDQGLADALVGVLLMALGLGGLRGGELIADRRWPRPLLAVIAVATVGLVAAATVHSPMASLATAGVAVFALASVWGAMNTPNLRWLAFAPAALLVLLQALSQASDLARLHPTAAQLAPIMIGAEAGAVLSAMAISAGAMALIWLVGRRLGGLRNFAVETSGAALIGLGLFWFVSRLHS